MVLAAVRDDAYNVVLMLHIISVLAAFAPAFSSPFLEARARKAEGDDGVIRLAKLLLPNSRQIHFPALIVAGVFGGALIGMSKTNDNLVWKLDQTWVWLGILVWVALCGVVSGVLLPYEKKLADGDMSASARVALGGQIASLLLVVQLFLMIFKPGA